MTAPIIGLQYGTVSWTAMLAIADGEDTGATPDIIPVSNGRVVFTPSADTFLIPSAVPPVTILGQPVPCTVENGRLVDSEGRTTVTLLADTPAVNPVGWTWRVDYELNDGKIKGGFDFHLSPNQAIDLTTAVPVGKANGVLITRGEKGDKGDNGVGIPEGEVDGLMSNKISTAGTATDAALRLIYASQSQLTSGLNGKVDVVNIDTDVAGKLNDPASLTALAIASKTEAKVNRTGATTGMVPVLQANGTLMFATIVDSALTTRVAALEVEPDFDLGIGTVATGIPGSEAAASITGTFPNKLLNLTIPGGSSAPTGGASGTFSSAQRSDAMRAQADLTRSAGLAEQAFAAKEWYEPWAAVDSRQWDGNLALVQSLDKRLYSTAAGGGEIHHAFNVTNGRRVRAVTDVNVVLGGSGTTPNATLFGFSNIASFAAENFYGIGVTEGGEWGYWEGGASTLFVLGPATAGNWKVVLATDEDYMSATATNADGSLAYTMAWPRVTPREHFNCFGLWHMDSRGLSGHSFGPISIKDSLATVAQEPTGCSTIVSGTDDSPHSEGHDKFRVMLPANYDSRVGAPLVISCNNYTGRWFHATPTFEAGLLAAGYAVMVPDGAGGAGFGNEAALEQIRKSYEWCRDNLHITGVAIAGHSMGGFTTSNLIRKKKIPGIAAQLAYYPGWSLNEQALNANYTAAVSAAHPNGVGDYDPSTGAPEDYLGVPLWVFTSPSDTEAPSATHGEAMENFVDGVATETMLHVVSTWHSDPQAWQAGYLTSAISFLKKYLGTPVATTAPGSLTWQDTLPPGATLTVHKLPTGTWPIRPTTRTDITVAWKGADPSPIVGSGGMVDNVDYRLVTT